jgi:hypothetical protein
MTIELKQVLNKLEEGKRLTIKFPSPKAREAFRVAMYKVKREIDEVLLMVDMDFETDVLRFEKSPLGAIPVTATIYLLKRSDLPKRGYDFEIVDESWAGESDDGCNDNSPRAGSSDLGGGTLSTEKVCSDMEKMFGSTGEKDNN